MMVRVNAILLFVVTGAVLAQRAVPPAAAEREMLAGHWHLDFYAQCVDRPDNRAACVALQSPAFFPVVDVPGSILTVRGVGDYISDARGRYTVHFVTTISERVPRGLHPTQCNNAIVFAGTYSGTCREEGWGTGHIARGATGMVDFWEDSAHGFWNGHPAALFAEATTADTRNPACPGRYGAARLLGLLGIKHVPAGITASLVLVRH